MLLDLKRECFLLTADSLVDSDCIEDIWDVVLREGGVNNGADDLYNFTISAHNKKCMR